MAQSLKTYLSNRTDVQGAARALLNYTKTYQAAKKLWQATPESAANYKAVLAAYNEAEAKYKELERAKNLAESNARVEYDAMRSKEQNEKIAAKDAEIQKDITSTQEQINKYTNAGKEVPANLQSKLNEEKAKLSDAPKGPKTNTNPPQGTGGAGGTGPNTADDLLVLDNLFKPGNEQLLLDVKKNLKKFGYTGPIDTKYSDAFKNAFNSALALRGNAPTNLKGNSLLEFIANPQGIDLGSIGSGGGPTIQAFIADDTKAAALVKEAFKTNLQREATPEEITKYSKILQAAQRKNPYKTTNGIRTGGIDETEFLAQQVQKLPEYSTKKAEKESLTAQSLQAVAKLNGINLSQEQLDAYTADIRNGRDINVIKNNIRQMAGLGRPDSIKKLLAEGTDLATIYSPYKTTMASLLELPEDQIDLNDNTLQSAIGPDKEMPLYEFRKALKKDARWQYTKNAEKEVSDVVLRVLKDFGFQG